MNADSATVLWKDWKEIVFERSAGGSGSYRPLLLIVLLGIFVPLRMGPERYFTAAGVLIPTMFSAFVIKRRYCGFLRGGAGTPYPRNTACQPPFRPRHSFRQDRRVGRLRVGNFDLLHPCWHDRRECCELARSDLDIPRCGELAHLPAGGPLHRAVLSQRRASWFRCTPQRCARLSRPRRRDWRARSGYHFREQLATRGVENLVCANNPDVVPDRTRVGSGRSAPGNRPRAVIGCDGPFPKVQARFRLTRASKIEHYPRRRMIARIFLSTHPPVHAAVG